VVTFLWDRAGVEERATRDVDVDDLLAAMTLDEKIAQLHGAGQMRGTVNRRLDVPAFEAADGPHGIGEAVWRYLYRHTDRATAFPVAIAIAASWDPDLAARVGGAIAREARAKGRNWLLAPALDLVRDPRAGRVFEAYGEDPHLTGRLGAAFVRGAQQQGVIATPKHFVCHHHETDRADIDVRVDERTLRELYLAPFEAAVRDGQALSIMAASHSVNGVHCTEHAWLLRTVLRDEWGFAGVVVSDWDATRSTEASILAGLDVEMPKPQYYGAPLLAAVESGRVPTARIDEAARHVLATKHAAGLFAQSFELDGSRVSPDEHRQLALVAARESIVLLENRGDFLPLPIGRGTRIAVMGPWARRPALGGRGSSEVKPLQAVSIADGLRGTVPTGVRVETLADWSDEESVAAHAAGADVVVLALGLGPRLEGESLDRAGNDLTLPADQVRLIERVLAATSRVVVVLYAGSAIAMDPWIERVPAVVLAWYPGELGGRALAEVLLGRVVPSGKLPLTFPRAASQLPAFGAFPQRVAEYREGVFVGYRHFDANALEPLYPFGFGRSYTRFEYADLRVSAHGAGPSIAIDVRFVVRNVGDRAGAEIAQVYVHDVEASVARPSRELRGFARLDLRPGETREVALELGWRDLAFFDESAAAWTVEPGEFEVQAGSSSRDLPLRQRFTYDAQ
jgi:beta-glucosidase